MMSGLKNNIGICFFGLVMVFSPVGVKVSEAAENVVTINSNDADFEMAESFGSFETAQNYDVPVITQQPRIKFYDSRDGQWNAGIGVAMLPASTAVNSSTDIYGIKNTAPFFSLRYKFKQKD